MALTVLTRAATSRLVPLSTVKARLGITGTDEDAVLLELIDEVSRAFASILAMPLVRQRYSEALAGRGRTRILLSRWPVDPASVTVTVGGTAVTDFVVESAETGVLYRESAWPLGACGAPGEEPEENIAVTYHAGFVPPGSSTAAGVWTPWAITITHPVGAWVGPTNLSSSPLLMEATVGGATHATTEPTWPTTAGSTVTDNAVTWTARYVHPLPDVVRGLAALAVRDLYAEQDTPAAVNSMEADGVSETRSISVVQEARGGISKGVIEGLRAWRSSWPS